MFGLAWFLQEVKFFKEDVWHKVFFRIVFTLVSVVEARGVPQSLV